jgi:hypothetical protein
VAFSKPFLSTAQNAISFLSTAQNAICDEFPPKWQAGSSLTNAEMTQLQHGTLG